MKGKGVVFKGTKEGIRMIVDASNSLLEIYQEIDRLIGEAQYFFNGAQVIVEVGSRNLMNEELERLKEIIVDQYDLNLLRVEGNEWQWVYTAAPNSMWEKKSIGKMKKTLEAGKKQMKNNSHNQNEKQSLLIKRTIRSGQRIEYDGNVVVLGDVNPGSEIVAGGDIIVMGTLRGIAHAGAKGNNDAIVMAFYLKPTQLRIAQYITRAPDGEIERIVEPEIAKVKNGTVVIEKYIPNRDNFSN